MPTYLSRVIKHPKLLFKFQISKLAPDWIGTGEIICFLLNKVLDGRAVWGRSWVVNAKVINMHRLYKNVI